MAEYYNWLKAFHLICVISWMVGLLYLPRIYVYHCSAKLKSSEDFTFQLMEKRLLKIIMLPAMILTLISGILLVGIYGFNNLGEWFHLKLTLVLILLYIHHFLGQKRKDFAQGVNKHSAKFYKIINEVPTMLMILIVILVIVKPFE